jgi:hypothetical protein
MKMQKPSVLLVAAAVAVLLSASAAPGASELAPIFGSFTNTSQVVTNDLGGPVGLDGVFVLGLTDESFKLAVVNKAGYTNWLVPIRATNSCVWLSNGAKVPIVSHGFLYIAKTNAQRTVKYTINRTPLY